MFEFFNCPFLSVVVWRDELIVLLIQLRLHCSKLLPLLFFTGMPQFFGNETIRAVDGSDGGRVVENTADLTISHHTRTVENVQNPI